MAQSNEYPVIIIGGSLVGLSAALFLSHWNIPVVVLERHPSSSLHPRAVGYTARTIELLKSVGAGDGIPSIAWKGGPPRRIVVDSLSGSWQKEVAWTNNKKDNASPPPAGQKPGSGPKPGQAPPLNYSHVQAVATAQDQIEPVLRANATRLGAELRLGHKVLEWSQDEDSVTVKAVSPEGSEYTLKGKYLVACDGGRSAVREKLGIKRDGVGQVRSLRSVMFKCPRIDEYLNHGYSQFQIENGDFEAFMTTYGGGRWMLACYDSTDSFDTPEMQRSLIRKATGVSDLADDDIHIITTGEWDICGLIAKEYSSGRVFLAGDAAHALPPNRGGFGANTGIADAHNLAWKLASVLQGRSKTDLLSTYTEERRPIAVVRHDQIFARDDYSRHVKDREWPGKGAAIIDDVALEFGQIYRSSGILGAGVDLPAAKRPDEWNGEPGIRAAHLNLRKGGETISTLDHFGKDWVVITSDAKWEEPTQIAAKDLGLKAQFVSIGRDVVEETEGEFRKLYGLDETGATLVRPDGFIAWRAIEKPENPLGDLREALSKASYAAKSE